LFSGSLALLGSQAIGILAVGVYVFCASWAMLALIQRFMGLRVAPEAENQGLDLSEHSETAYGA
ncbi:MAG TPA: ammonia channel protein, partial [Deltaproteobacteria bacterium]|nr:ammonia channel protein [Deltaproteobacteria bacterium]